MLPQDQTKHAKKRPKTALHTLLTTNFISLFIPVKRANYALKHGVDANRASLVPMAASSDLWIVGFGERSRIDK